jgi:D-alanyl-D-alanine carboxypeptidase
MQTRYEELDHSLALQATENKFSGVVLIADDGEPIFHKAYGLASKRFHVPNRVDTKFNLGSINKIFTVVAILQLAEKGSLALDDPLSKFRPDFPPEIGDKVTIRHLLQHRAGLGDYWEHEVYLATWTTLRTVEGYMAFIKDIPLAFEPGERQQYSNSGFQVLGAVLEAITGGSYYDYVRANVYEPAGMADTDSYEMDMPVETLAIGYTDEAPPGGGGGKATGGKTSLCTPSEAPRREVGSRRRRICSNLTVPCASSSCSPPATQG